MTASKTSPQGEKKSFISSATPDGAYGATPAGRGKVLLIAAVLVAVGVSAGIWQMGVFGGSSGEFVADRFTVTERSFSVTLREKGELKPIRSTNIASAVEGRSTIISLIAEGTAVEKGDLLVELATDQVDDRISQEELKETNAITAYEASKTELEIQRDKNDSDIRKAKLKIELSQLELEKYRDGEWKQKLTDADIAIQQAEISRKRRKEDLEAATQLLKRDWVTKLQFAEDEFNFTKAEWDLEKANQAKEVLLKYTHVADLRRRESDLEEAKKEADRTRKNAEAEEIKRIRAVEGKQKELALIQDQLAKLHRQKENSRILAPAKGFVVYYAGGGGRHMMSSDSQIREGATVHERQILMTLPDTSAMLVIVRVHEAKTDKLKLGQLARVTIEGIPNREFSGVVTKIAAVADSQNRWLNPDLKEYETEIKLDPVDIPLKPGVTAHAEILVQSIDHQLAVPVQAVYSKSGQRYVFRDEGKEVVPVKITVGAIGTEWAEVSNGLTTGDLVLLAFSDDHKRMIPDVPLSERGRSRMGASRTSHKPASRKAGAKAGPPAGAKGKRGKYPTGSSRHGQAGKRDAMGTTERVVDGATHPTGARSAGMTGPSTP